MKIVNIKAYPIVEELNHETFGFSQGWITSRQACIVLVSTDEGVVGIGESFGPAETIAKAVETYIGPMIIGRDPFQSAMIWDSVYAYLRANSQKGILIEALSAVDIALWDIKGKFLGVPIYQLLGGAYRDRALAYATGLYRPTHNPTAALLEEALGYKNKGYLGMKLKIGHVLPEEDLAIVKAIRDAIGYDIKLMVDANCAYDATQAIKMSREMEQYDIYWFEEPVPPEDIDGCLEVKNKSNIPIASGESEATRYGFREIITKHAVDIVQPDVCTSGGFTEAQKILAMASAWNMQCVPHVWGTNVAIAAALQFYAAIPHIPIKCNPPGLLFEYDESFNPIRDKTIHEKIVVKDSYIDIPKKPGLGVTIDMDFVQSVVQR